jgi:hypothetical protein
MPAKKNVNPDPIPESFASAEAAGEFWDRHDLGDYLDQTRPVEMESCRIERRQYLLALEPALARKLSEAARQRGVSSEVLANLWLSERLNTLSEES